MKKTLLKLITSIGLSALSIFNIQAQCISTIASGYNFTNTATGKSNTYYGSQDGNYTTYQLSQGYSYEFTGSFCTQGQNTCLYAETNFFLTLTDKNNTVLGTPGTKIKFTPDSSITVRVHNFRDNNCGTIVSGMVRFDVNTTSLCKTNYAYAFKDEDGDGYGIKNDSLRYCENIPVGYVNNKLDCNDKDANQTVQYSWYPDVDGDGFGDGNVAPIVSCAKNGVIKRVKNGIDCNDKNKFINPSAKEIEGNNIDENCDGIINLNNSLGLAENSIVNFPNTENWSANNNYTIEFWIKPTSTINTYNYILSKGNLSIYLYGPTRLFTDDGREMGSLQLNKWNHIAISYKPNNLDFYINGVYSNTNYNNFSLGTKNLQLGTPTGTQYNFTSVSSIDELRIWSITKTLTEILESYNKAVDVNSPNLVAYYNFNQGISKGNNSSIPLLLDATSNAFHGNFTNVTLTDTISNFKSGVPSLSLKPIEIKNCTKALAYNFDATATSNLENVCKFFTQKINAYQIANKIIVDTAVNSSTDCNFDYLVAVDSAVIKSVTKISGQDSISVSWKIYQGNVVTSFSTKYPYKLSGDILFVLHLSCTNPNNRLSSIVNGLTFVSAANFDESVITSVKNNISLSYNVSIYPNPTNGRIDLNSSAMLGNVSIYNALGTVVYQQKVEQNTLTLDLSNQQSGVYFVKVGNSVFKLIKE